ncbi:MAG: gamma-glutamyltransferase [Magnetovibrionaceae bacterium]
MGKSSMQSGIAAGHPLTAEAVAEVLAEGGNAFDGIAAGLLAAAVVEPVLSSLGGGGFLLAEPEGARPRVYDFFAQTPKQKRSEAELDFRSVIADFGTQSQEFHIGAGSVAVPGLFAGVARMVEDLGRLDLKRVCAPAIRLAKAGPPLNKTQAYIISVVTPIYGANRDCLEIFGGGSGRDGLKAEGEALPMPAFADALDALAHDGADLFYRGEIAERLVEVCSQGGHLTRADLEGYEVALREPLMVANSDYRLSINPPPSSGGLLIALSLRLLEALPAAAGNRSGPAAVSRLAAVFAETNRARLEHDLDEQAARGLGELAPDLIAAYRQGVLGRTGANRGTTHISVIDSEGSAASATVSNGEGAGLIVPGTGIMLNNMLGEEDINPKGFHQWMPDRRLASMMAPALLEQKDGAKTVLGSGGSNRIRSAILQVLVNLLDHGMPLDVAIAEPRLHGEGSLLSYEAGACGLPVDLEDLSPPAGYETCQYWPEPCFFFGGVHGVRRQPNGRIEAYGDPRRGGAAKIV